MDYEKFESKMDEVAKKWRAINAKVEKNTLTDKVRENFLRRKAKRFGLILKKSRARQFNLDNYLGFMVIDASTNFIICGSKFELDLDEVNDLLREYEDA